MRVKNLVILLSAVVLVALLTSCKSSSSKKSKSDVTGWNYNDKNMGGYQIAKAKDQNTGPGLVFVQGGTFTMGQTEEDVMGDWNNIPRRVSVPSFYIDRTEVANVHYREYLFWLQKVFDPSDPVNVPIIEGALPDTLCWRSELSYNEPLVEYYFRHPGFNFYPVVGVSWKQASDFCLWRGDRVNEGILLQKGYINKQGLQGQQGSNNFTTKSYLLDLYQTAPGKTATSKKNNPLKTAQGQPRTKVSMEDGLLLPDYRLPFEAEWEYAAYGLINQNPRPSLKEGKRGEELQSNKQIYPWSQNVSGLRDTRHGSWQGQFLANFKRGSGDNAGVAGGLNDRAFYTAEVKSFYPNGFGLYNMAGNVSEWVQDVYRPLSSLDYDDMPAPFRGNVYMKLYKDPTTGEAQINDTTGKVKMVQVTDAESKGRRNYQRGNVIDYLDGDSTSQANYGYGTTTLISDKSRVYKGGSWNDRAYWLSPGTRRFLEEDQSLSTLGFRCAMDRMGSPEGNKRKTGQFFPTKRQKR
ncbi:MAG: SUMF1/EgtB/PvdO family nonheme iron enzyme [Bacteroidota bacterium]|nr:SUMF1/EgtB/PvdO family nonheme iron enzyme [Bacteroidota bacterium]